MFNSAARADRRRRDKDQRRAARNRRIGHETAYIAEAWERAPSVIIPIAIAAGVAWAWLNMDHADIVRILSGAGSGLCLTWLGRNVAARSSAAQAVDRAAGVTRNLWHPIGIAGVVLLTAAFLVWRSLP